MWRYIIRGRKVKACYQYSKGNNIETLSNKYRKKKNIRYGGEVLIYNTLFYIFKLIFAIFLALREAYREFIKKIGRRKQQSIRNIGNLRVILLIEDKLRVLKQRRCVSSRYAKYLRLRDTKLIYRVIDSELSSKLGTGIGLKIVIAERITTRMYLCNGLAYTATKVNWYTEFYQKEYFTVY